MVDVKGVYYVLSSFSLCIKCFLSLKWDLSLPSVPQLHHGIMVPRAAAILALIHLILWTRMESDWSVYTK